MEIRPVPLLGNFADCFFMKKSPGEFIKGLYDESNGLPYMGFYIFDKPFFLIRDPELVKHVFVKDFDHFADKYSETNIKDRLGWANLFMIKNPAWKVLRSKLTPFFTSGKLKKMFDLMVQVGNDLDAHLESLSLEGEIRVRASVDARRIYKFFFFFFFFFCRRRKNDRRQGYLRQVHDRSDRYHGLRLESQLAQRSERGISTMR